MHKQIARLQVISGIFRLFWIVALIVAFAGAVIATQNREGGVLLIAALYNAAMFFLINVLLDYLCRMGEMLDNVARYEVKNNDMLKELKAESDRRKLLT